MSDLKDNLILPGILKSKTVAFGHSKTAPIHWIADATEMSPEVQYSHDFLENEQGVAVTLSIRPCWRSFFFHKKLKRWLLVIFGFKRDGGTCHTTVVTLIFFRLGFFLRSHYQPQSWWRLASSELRLDTVGLSVFQRQARDKWLLKGQYSWSHS